MNGEHSWRGARVYTIGHSTRSLDELTALLRTYGVSMLVDIRTVPRSRHNPQFNVDVLGGALRSRGIGYVHLAALGGLRHARKDSTNMGWRNASFRGYADYMQTPSFEEGLEELRALAARDTVAIMCAEAVPWRCHRSLVADALAARGATVEHIVGAGRANPHKLTPFAKVEDEHVTYPGDEQDPHSLATRSPFHLEATVRVLQRRPSNLVDVWDDGRYLRVLPSSSGPVLVEVENRGTLDRPDLRLSVRHGDEAKAVRGGLLETLRTILGLDIDPAPMQRLAEDEPALRPTAMALRGMRPPRYSTLFEAFANVIPFQQVSLDAGVAVTRRIVERFGARIEHGERTFHAFPLAETIADARLSRLKSCGLSARKAESLRGAARTVASGELTEDMLTTASTPEALQALMALPGIGPWSAGLVLLRGLGRLDVFPSGDVGVERGLTALLHVAPGAPLLRVVERFGDLRGYLYFCSLGKSLLKRGLIGAAPPRATARVVRGGPPTTVRTAIPPRRGPRPSARADTRRSPARHRTEARRR